VVPVEPVADVIAAVVLAGVALGGLSVTSRVRFARQPGAFRCRLGTPPYSRVRKGSRWRLCRTRARWVSDVLIVQSGLLRLGATPMAAHVASDTVVRTLSPSEVRGLGKRPAVLLLTLDDQLPLEVAVAEASRPLLVGPYLAAGLTDLPRAPREQGA
jgi:hypothetical protein